MVTGNEKLIIYDNMRKRYWDQAAEPQKQTPKLNIHAQKVLLGGISKGIFYYELLPDNQTINLDVYCSQLEKLHPNI